MHSRRALLSLATVVGTTTLAGCSSIGGGSLTGPPPTDNKIGEVAGPTETVGNLDVDISSDMEDADLMSEELALPIQRVDFYESGAANVIPTEEHGCYDQFAIMHSATDLGRAGGSSDAEINTEDALGVWSFGDFDEPVTIDLQGAISQRSNYPDREFKLRVVPDEGACIDDTQTMTFQVPESYLPSE